ncbi:MAG: thioesterase family protein [Deltaproteobacteria bacterium]|nr:thioesterase family protein [Deltaproteobacteria bacterium]
MHAEKPSLSDMLKILADVYENKLPFNKVLGLRIERIEPDNVRVAFDMRPELVGNYVHGVLHGGVISSVLDATGGMVASIGVVKKLRTKPPEEIAEGIYKVGTIDLRVDYLRPGLGQSFYATGTTMRSGKKVTVARMELHNDLGKLIAVGTGTYIVG